MAGRRQLRIREARGAGFVITLMEGDTVLEEVTLTDVGSLSSDDIHRFFHPEVVSPSDKPALNSENVNVEQAEASEGGDPTDEALANARNAELEEIIDKGPGAGGIIGGPVDAGQASEDAASTDKE